MTKLVCSEESSWPRNLTVTVFPLYAVTLNDFWTYVVFLFRLEYVASVVVVPPSTIWIFAVSYTVEVVVSAVSILIQKDSVALVAEAGMATDWFSFSVVVVPLPWSHIFQVPVRAGRPVLLVIGPAVPVQFTAPDSKPGFSSRL